MCCRTNILAARKAHQTKGWLACLDPLLTPQFGIQRSSHAVHAEGEVI